jgi:hypothetical protein
MSESANRNGTSTRGGWVVVAVTLGLLFGMVLLKAGADSGEELDD